MKLGHIEKASSSTTRRFWLKKKKKKKKGGVKIFIRCRKVINWKPFSIVLMLSRSTRKIVKKYVVGRILLDQETSISCPAIVFTCQWGLPVLSHFNTYQKY